jgi:beta-fructofuranosidase
MIFFCTSCFQSVGSENTMAFFMASITAFFGLFSLVSAQSSLTTLTTGTVTQSATTTYSQANVPTGVSIPGNYDGTYRPQVHYSPPQGFMNDPNGMFVDGNGTYHLYYQCKSMQQNFIAYAVSLTIF